MAEQSQLDGPTADLEKQDERDESGEFESTKDKSNKQVIEDNWAQLYAQDKKVEVISKNMDYATEQARDYNKEVNDQTKMIGNMNDHMDQQNEDIIKATNNMTKLMALSNQWCLWGIFALEVILLLVMVIFM